MKTVISVKVDKDVRDRAKKAAKRIGIPLSMVINETLRRFARDRYLEVGKRPKYLDEN